MADAHSQTDAFQDESEFLRKVDPLVLKSAGTTPPAEPPDDKQTTAVASPSTKASDGPPSTEKEPREPLIGSTGLLMLILFLGAAAILLFRWWGFLPLANTSNVQKPVATKIGEANRAYVLITTYNEKLYYFDQRQERIVEVQLTPAMNNATALAGAAPINTPVSPLQRGPAKLIRAINQVLPSPDKQKVALIANRDAFRTHVFVLDFTKLESQTEFLTCWTEKLPGDYSVRAQDMAAWSPDNQTLAFVAGKGDQPDLFIATSKDRVQRVTYHGKNIGTVLWLDAQRLAFVSNLESQDEMYIIYPNWGVKEIAK